VVERLLDPVAYGRRLSASTPAWRDVAAARRVKEARTGRRVRASSGTPERDGERLHPSSIRACATAY
jgi:hypothetical protein